VLNNHCRWQTAGRISGLVWLDTNENGKLDEGEQPLTDVRVVAGSDHDTLTDEKGYFIIGDLPPGEHILLLDEKTLPEGTRSVAGSQTVKVCRQRNVYSFCGRAFARPNQEISQRLRLTTPFMIFVRAALRGRPDKLIPKCDSKSSCTSALFGLLHLTS
jgi:hypothetical protein